MFAPASACDRLAVQTSSFLRFAKNFRGWNRARRLPMKFKTKWAGILVVAVGASLAACQDEYHQKDEQYYLIAANVNVPYWQEAQAGLTDAAKNMGVKAEMDGPAAMSPKDELDSFNKAVALHPAGILVSVSSPDLSN